MYGDAELSLSLISVTAKALPVQHVLWHFGDLKCGLNDLLAAEEELALVDEPIEDEEDQTQIQLFDWNKVDVTYPSYLVQDQESGRITLRKRDFVERFA